MSEQQQPGRFTAPATSGELATFVRSVLQDIGFDASVQTMLRLEDADLPAVEIGDTMLVQVRSEVIPTGETVLQWYTGDGNYYEDFHEALAEAISEEAFRLVMDL